MGACTSAPRSGKRGEAADPFPITVAFENCPPVTLTIAPDEQVQVIRERVRDEMEARRDTGAPITFVDGPIMTVRSNSGEAVALDDAMSVYKARIEPRQYFWFQDRREDARVRAVVLRGSRLTEDVVANSRGVKQGMMALQREDEAKR